MPGMGTTPAMIELGGLLAGPSVFALGLVASLMASLGTAVGALPVLGLPRVSQRLQDVLQSFAAGIMLAAAALSLILPGLASATTQLGTPVAGALVICAGVLLGSGGIFLVHRHAPHEHFLRGPEGPATRRLRRTWLFVIAITLHNFPEGLAVGVGFGGGDAGNGAALAIAIFLQNIPEGFIVALGLVAAGYPRGYAVLVACATGFVETAGGLAGAAAVSLARVALPWAMGIAAGAMLFVISHEIVPETHRNGYEDEATFGLIGGFLLMVLMNAVFA